MNLQLYLSLGMELEEVHKCIAFDQDDFARKFIEKTTMMRAKAKTKVQKSIWKFINNIV